MPVKVRRERGDKLTFDDQPGFRGAGGYGAPTAPSVPPPGPVAAPSPPPAASPATLVPDLSFAGSVGTAVGHRSGDRYKPRFSYQARSPLPHLVVLLLVVAVAVFAFMNIDVAAFDQSTDMVETSTGSVVESPDRELDEGMALLAIAAAFVAFIALCVLIGRIGRNSRGMVSTFGGWTAAVALPAWHLSVLNRASVEGVDTYGALLAVYVVCLLLALVGYCILQPRLFRRLWEAGGFGGAGWSAVLWVPPAVTWILMYASATFTVISIGEDGQGSSSWEPTERMALITDGATVAASLGLLALVVAVSIAQHRGIAADRAAIRAERANADGPVV